MSPVGAAGAWLAQWSDEFDLPTPGIPWHDHGRKMTVVGRLPAWMKQARNRDEVLRAIARIHASLRHA